MKTTRLQLGDRMPLQPPFRIFLREELGRRCTKNPQYSLRAFAIDLGTDHSTLSQLMRGTRAMTEPTLARLATRLGLHESEIAGFVERERSELGVSPMHEELSTLTQDAACVVTQWQHHAILELTHLACFRPDSRWIASVLDIGVDDVNVALQRLLRLGLLSMSQCDSWTDKASDALYRIDAFNQVAIRALFQTAVGYHTNPLASGRGSEQSSTTMALDSGVVSQMIDCIVRFRRRMRRMAASGRAADDVYRLDVRFYPITTLQQERNDGPARHSLADHYEEPGQGD